MIFNPELVQDQVLLIHARHHEEELGEGMLKKQHHPHLYLCEEELGEGVSKKRHHLRLYLYKEELGEGVLKKHHHPRLYLCEEESMEGALKKRPHPHLLYPVYGQCAQSSQWSHQDKTAQVAKMKQ